MNSVAVTILIGATQVAGRATPADSLERVHIAGALGAKLDTQLTRYERAGFAGTVLVVRDRRIVLLKGYGRANIETRTWNTPSTRFEWNSLTKMLTGVSILQLAAGGRLTLDASVERYLGEFPPAKGGATLEHLATHTAGLVVAGTNLAGNTRDAFVADVKRAPIESPPGERYRYTNAGYSLLAAIIEHVSGMPYHKYLRQNLFVPAGMHTATFRDHIPAGDPLFARGYVAGDSGRGPMPGPANPYVWGTIGAGGVWSTVGDMYRWLVALEDSMVLRGRERALLFAPPKPPSLEAYGWHVYPATDSTRARIEKGGASSDFATQLLYFRDDRVAVLWASNNLVRRWRQTLNRAIPDLIFTGSTNAALPAR